MVRDGVCKYPVLLSVYLLLWHRVMASQDSFTLALRIGPLPLGWFPGHRFDHGARESDLRFASGAQGGALPRDRSPIDGCRGHLFRLAQSNDFDCDLGGGVGRLHTIRSLLEALHVGLIGASENPLGTGLTVASSQYPFLTFAWLHLLIYARFSLRSAGLCHSLAFSI